MSKKDKAAEERVKSHEPNLPTNSGNNLTASSLGRSKEDNSALVASERTKRLVMSERDQQRSKVYSGSLAVGKSILFLSFLFFF